ncbi:hypothetical protein C8R47DRAFT_1322689 [Mycena vitilis]|nr:hypothetical protein C8R47DRAFT_1322689 [Mycena vitilis]
MHASLRLNSMSSLAEPLKTLAMSAANGSLDDLVKLHGLIPDTPFAQLRFFIPAFYANLATRDIPDLRRQLDTKLPAVKTRISKVVLALKGISDLQEHLVSRAHGEVWVSAWAWIRFFEECEKCRPCETGTATSDLHLLYLETILSLSQDTETLLTIISTPGVRLLFSKGWVVAVGRLQTSDKLILQLNEFLLGTNPKNPRNLEELIEGAGGTPNDFASLLVSHIRLAAPHRDHTLSDQDGLALLPIFVFLHDVGLMDGPLRGPLRSYSASFAILVAHIMAHPGFPAVQQALAAGLLRAILVCTSRRMPHLDFGLHLLLRDILPKSLVYHSVLSVTQAALDDAKDLANTREFRASPFVQEWNNFVEVATERLVVMERYNNGKLGAWRACDHLECGAMRKDDTLLRCAACHNAFYCSKECQVTDWTDGHRKLCKTDVNRPQEITPQLTFRDRDFLRALLHHDYEAARAEVLALQIGCLRRTPNDLCFVKFDYRAGRVAIEAAPSLGELPATNQQGRPDKLGLCGRAARSGGRMELHVMLVGEGEHARGHCIPLRLAHGVVHERVSAIAIRGEAVTPAVLEELLALEVERTH